MSDGAPKSERSRSQGQALFFRGNRQGPGRSEGWRGSRNLEGEKVRSRGTQFRRARLGVSFVRQAKRCPEDGRGRKEVNQQKQIEQHPPKNAPNQEHQLDGRV